MEYKPYCTKVRRIVSPLLRRRKTFQSAMSSITRQKGDTSNVP